MLLERSLGTHDGLTCHGDRDLRSESDRTDRSIVLVVIVNRSKVDDSGVPFYPYLVPAEVEVKPLNDCTLTL